MKHFLFLIGIVFIVVACNSQNKTSSSIDTISSKPIPASDSITLNGYTKDEAGKMIKAFLNNRTSSQDTSRTNIWFSKVYLDKLYSTLLSERKADSLSGKKIKTDGLRVYFAKDSTGNYEIIVVSTKGLDVPKRQKTTHYDYFIHNAPFFITPLAKGVTRHDKTPGAELYNPYCKCNDDNGCNIGGYHFVPYKKAQKWVDNYSKDKKEPINTKSEWFDMDFFGGLKIELNNAPRKINADGIRIYFSRKNELDTEQQLRHHFVVVTTKLDQSLHKDYFECYNLKNKLLSGGDNGEQCEHNCSGTTAW